MVEVASQNGAGAVTVQVFNLQGRLVYQQEFAPQQRKQPYRRGV